MIAPNDTTLLDLKKQLEIEGKESQASEPNGLQK